MQTIGSKQASTRFGHLLNVVEKGAAITVTRNNREMAIMLSPEDFELLGGEVSLQEKKRQKMQTSWSRVDQLMTEIQEEAEKNGLTEEILSKILRHE